MSRSPVPLQIESRRPVRGYPFLVGVLVGIVIGYLCAAVVSCASFLLGG